MVSRCPFDRQPEPEQWLKHRSRPLRILLPTTDEFLCASWRCSSSGSARRLLAGPQRTSPSWKTSSSAGGTGSLVKDFLTCSAQAISFLDPVQVNLPSISATCAPVGEGCCSPAVVSFYLRR